MVATEIEAATEALDTAEETARRQDQSPDELIAKERALLARVQPAPDDLAEGIDLYPLPGYTPGQCGLLISEPTRTTIGRRRRRPHRRPLFRRPGLPRLLEPRTSAKESLAEMYEIADLIIPGHDNLFLTPRVGG